MAKLETTTYIHDGRSVEAHFRPGTSDADALKEVVERHAYRRVRDKFDVLPGERWLDLGANIGAFAIYCRLRGASADSYEPMEENVRILKKNLPKRAGTIHAAAVTASCEPYLEFRVSNNPDNHYRGTAMQDGIHVPERYVETDRVPNICIDTIDTYYDGIKMDIEGSEHGILDEIELLPQCKKLVLEYHTSRDSSVANLARRLLNLKERFPYVKYPKAYDDAIASGAESYRPRFDHIIFAWE